MRIRQILLIHPVRSIRALIKKYVFAELSDVAFVETDTCESALAELRMNPFDVVVISAGLNGMPLKELRSAIRQTEHNAAVPCIILSENEEGQERQMLNGQGFDHVVELRVRPADLIQILNQVCNPRNWREDHRYYIPSAEVLIEGRTATAEAHMINISNGGILVELITNTPELLIQDNIYLTIWMPGPDGVTRLENLPGMLSRLHVLEWHPDNRPAAMRATILFGELSQEKQNDLEQVLRLVVENRLGDAGG